MHNPCSNAGRQKNTFQQDFWINYASDILTGKLPKFDGHFFCHLNKGVAESVHTNTGKHHMPEACLITKKH